MKEKPKTDCDGTIDYTSKFFRKWLLNRTELLNAGECDRQRVHMLAIAASFFFDAYCLWSLLGLLGLRFCFWDKYNLKLGWDTRFCGINSISAVS